MSKKKITKINSECSAPQRKGKGHEMYDRHGLMYCKACGWKEIGDEIKLECVKCKAPTFGRYCAKCKGEINV